MQKYNWILLNDTMNSTRFNIIMIGTFPPPINGMAMATQAIFNRLLAEGWQIEKLDTAPRSLSRQIFARLGRLSNIITAWWQLVSTKWHKKKEPPIAYIALSGGWGQIYDLITIAICRIKKIPCILHHHSVAYLSKKSLLTACLCKIAGLDAAAHVVLCQSMKRWLKDLYGVEKITVLSNSAFFPVETKPLQRDKLHVVGFLSNITYEKGGDTVIALAREIQQRNWPLRVVVAGPCHDEYIMKKLKIAIEEGVLEWLGPVYGEDKSQFWKITDAFVFPTQYENEAEPLVLWEALAIGAPIISYNRGCIPSQLVTSGVTIDEDKDFIEVALKILEEWQNPVRFRAASEQARCRYTEAYTTNKTAWSDFTMLFQKRDIRAK